MKYLFSLLLLVSTILPVGAVEFPYGGADSEYYFDSSVDMGQELAAATVDDSEGLLHQLLEMYELDGYEGEDRALRYVRGIINLILSLTSFVVFVRFIYGFYAMFFSLHEDGIARARKIIKVCVIALFLIGLAWLLTTFFFYIYYAITGGLG